MFEHSLYEAETVAEPLHEGDPLYNYEIRTWDLGPRVYKILGISAAANLLVFLVFTATPVLTMKGCDSPLVGSVCQVLDTLYVGSTLMGTDREYVDAVYDKTKIGDADVTFVDVSGVTPPLAYPEGYFQVANPEQYQAMLAMQNDPALAGDTGGTLPGIPPGITLTRPSQGTDLFNTHQRLPRANPSAVSDDLPSGFGGTTTASNGRPGGKGGKNGGKTIDDAAVNPTPSPTPAQQITTESVQGVQINKLPLTDLADIVNTRIQKKEVDLDKNFTLTMYGVIAADGTLDAKKSRYDVAKQQGDPAMIEVAKTAMEKLGSTGFLQYLRQIGVDKVTATITQDDQNLTVVISSAAPTVERAQSMASSMGAVLLIGKATAKNPSTERQLLDGAQVMTDGKKNFILNFAMPKAVAQDMIKKALQDALAKKMQPQPSSDAGIKSSSNTALNK